MADGQPPIIGDAGAFERSAKAILARAEAALRASVQTLTEVRTLTGQIEAAAAASAGEEHAAAVINEKANAAERAAAAVHAQNAAMREAAAAAAGETAAAEAIERKALAAERATEASIVATEAGVRGSTAEERAALSVAAARERAAASAGAAERRAEANMRASAARTDDRLRAAEQTPVRRVQGQEAARQLQEQARAQRELAANSAGAHRGLVLVAQGGDEAGRAVRESAVNMALANRQANDLGNRLLTTAKSYGEFALATGGLFALVGLFHHLTDGAQETQQGVQALRRVMERPVDAGEAGAGFARLSREMNVPIKDAAEATALMARQFHDLPGALNAARVALGFTKLDAIGAADSIRFLGAAAQAFKIAPEDLERRIADPIEQVARRGGEPPAQILRAFAASAQIANAGGSPEQFAGLVGAAIRASAQTGNVIATAFQRSIANAIPRPAAQATIKSLGLDPQEATSNYTQFLIDAIKRSRDLTANQRRDLALAIGGKFYGSRVFQPLLERPEQSLERVGYAGSAQGAFADELNKQLARADERISAIGNGLQRIGAALGASGVLSPFIRLAQLLGFITDQTARFVETFARLPLGPLRGLLVTAGELYLVMRLMSRLNVAERFARITTPGGRLGGFVSQETRDRAAARDATQIERDRVARDLEQSRARQLSAASRYQGALGEGALLAAQRPAAQGAEMAAWEKRMATSAAAIEASRERFLAADRQTSALLNAQLELTTREAITAEEIAAMRARTTAATAAGAAAATAGLAAEGAAAGAAAGRLGGTKGVIGEGGLLTAVGGLAGLGRMVGIIAAFEVGMRALEGAASTKGNVVERFAGAGRNILGLVGAQGLVGPITGQENRKAGAEAAKDFLAGLGPTPASTDFNALDRRRMDITKRLGDIDASGGTRVGPFVVGGPDARKAAEETRKLSAELDHLTKVEQAAAAAARSRRTGASGTQALLGLNSKELQTMLGESLLPLTTVGDDSGLTNAVNVAEAFSQLGHTKNRSDLLEKADQAIRQIVGAISQELDDSLSLATSQRERSGAYRKAEQEASKLLASTSPDARRRGALLFQQIAEKRLQDFAQSSQANQQVREAERPGDITGNAAAAADRARSIYIHTRATYGREDARTRQAFAQYQAARNAANDARLQQIELDTASAQSQQLTAIGKDNALVAGLRRELNAARSAPHPNRQKIAELENQLAQAQQQRDQQIIQDANAATDAYYQYLEAQTEDPLTQAVEEYQRIARQRVDPSDPNAAAKQRAALAQAAQAVRRAQHQRLIDNINADQQLADASTDPSDAVAIARHAERAARRTLAAGGFATEAERKTALANQRKTAADTVRARQQAAYDDIEHNAAVGKLTTDMEVAALRRMLSTVHNNKALRRQIEEQIYQLTHQDSGALELALGNIRLPSPYEVNRALREGSQAGRARGVTAQTNVTVNVANREDAETVYGHIDRALGTTTRSALRAAGAL